MSDYKSHEAAGDTATSSFSKVERVEAFSKYKYSTGLKLFKHITVPFPKIPSYLSIRQITNSVSENSGGAS